MALTILGWVAVSQPATAIQRAVPRDAAVPFRVGETLTYDVTWSTYLVAGSATATVRERQTAANSPAYYIVAEGRPLPMLARLYNLYYKMDTWLDVVTLLPQRGSLYTEEGSRRRTATTRYDRARQRAFFEAKAEVPDALEFDVPPQVQDGLSAVYVLRAMTFKPGDRITVPVADEGSVYSVRVHVVGSERVKVPLGEHDAWNLQVSITDAAGDPAANNVGVWISTDSRRLPLRLQAELPVGEFVLNLRQATN
jgi:hypothetical protein